MSTESGTTFYVITPDPPALLLADGDFFVLIPHVNSTHHARVEVKNCTGDYPLLRWQDRTRSFVPVGDDFLVQDVATAITWNAATSTFIAAAQAVNIHGWEWERITGQQIYVGKGVSRILWADYGIGTCYADLTTARQYSELWIHNGGKGRVVVRSGSIGSVAVIYRKAALVRSDIVLEAGETLHMVAWEENKYTVIMYGAYSLPPGGGGDTFIPDTFAGAGTTGYVPDPGAENGFFMRDDGSWQPISTTGISAKYLWAATISGDPAAGHIGVNSSTLSLVTAVRIHKITNGGNDITAVIADLKVGALIAIFEQTAPYGTSLFRTTGAPVLTGSWFTVPAAPTPYTGMYLPAAQDAPLNVTFTASTSNIPHYSLTNITPDDHHPQAHAHDGLDGSGAIAHASTTGQTPNDHHPQLHDLDSHTDVEIVDPVDAEVLTLEGGVWKNKPGGGGGGVTDHEDLSNVTSDQHHAMNHGMTDMLHHLFPTPAGKYLRDDGTWQVPDGAGGGGSAQVIIKVVDDIDVHFNGVRLIFELQVFGVPIDVVRSEELLVNLNGIIQDPASYTVGNNEITFQEAPKTSAKCNILWFQPMGGLVQKMVIVGYIELPKLKNYPAVPWGTFDYTVTGIYIAVESGTMNVSILVNGAPAPGLSNLNVSSTPILIENLVVGVAGNRQIDVSVNSATDAVNLEYSIFAQRTMV